MTRWLVVSLTLGVIGGTALAEDAARQPLRVLSYNVQFLPGPASFMNKRGAATPRAAEIAKRVADYDIIGFCEVFEDAPRKTLLDGLKATWGADTFAAVEGPPSAAKNRYNGGLAIATKLPLVASHKVVYSEISRIKDYGLAADEFASKGVLHARILASKDAKPGDFVDVFVTHMDARERKARRAQIIQFAGFVKEHADATRPTLLLGDFNVRGDEADRADQDSDYQHLFRALGSNGTPVIKDTWLTFGQGPSGTSDQEGPTGGRRIDYIFFASPNQDSFAPRVLKVLRFLDPKFGALSDHNAVEGEFFWSALVPR